MKTTNILTTTLMASLFPVTVFAAAHAMDPATLTCADFMDMEMEAQRETYTAIHSAAMDAEGTPPVTGNEAEMMDTLEKARDANETAEGQETTEEQAMEGAAEMAEDDAGATGTADANSDVEQLVAACEGNGDMLAMDAMKSAMDS